MTREKNSCEFSKKKNLVKMEKLTTHALQPVVFLVPSVPSVTVSHLSWSSPVNKNIDFSVIGDTHFYSASWFSDNVVNFCPHFDYYTLIGKKLAS